MTRIDQFESVFKAAARTVYDYERIEVPKVLVVTDLDRAGAESFRDRAASFLTELTAKGQAVDWQAADRERSATIGDLLELVEGHAPDLVVTYRNLHTQAWRWPLMTWSGSNPSRRARLRARRMLPGPAL